jgi:hypothetical protein
MANETLKSVMVYPTSLTTTFSGPGVDVSQYLGYYLQAVFDYSGGGTSAGTVKLQTSIDGVNYDDYPNSSKAITSATTSASWEVYYKFHQYVRVAWVNGSGTNGSMTVNAMYTRETK